MEHACIKMVIHILYNAQKPTFLPTLHAIPPLLSALYIGERPLRRRHDFKLFVSSVTKPGDKSTVLYILAIGV